MAAKQLTDDIEARMVVNGKYGPVYTYTVKDYLNYLLEHDYPQQAKELAGTLLVYGGKAQLYFGYRTDALAGTAEPNSTANWGSYQFESSGTQTDDYYGSSLLLEPVIQIRHYFMVPDGAECTFTFAWNAGEPETELQPVDTNTRFDGKEVLCRYTGHCVPPCGCHAGGCHAAKRGGPVHPALWGVQLWRYGPRAGSGG